MRRTNLNDELPSPPPEGSKERPVIVDPTTRKRIRPIQQSDNSVVAAIIRDVMAEYECTGVGYSCNDPEVDAMYEAYSDHRSAFYVVEVDGDTLGCGGIAPLAGANDDVTCELRKMYFRKELRGLGLGRELLKTCLSEAWNSGFRRCYIESVERMTSAISLYQKFGFQVLDHSLGTTGHSKCDVCLVRELRPSDAFSTE